MAVGALLAAPRQDAADFELDGRKRHRSNDFARSRDQSVVLRSSQRADALRGDLGR